MKFRFDLFGGKSVLMKSTIDIEAENKQDAWKLILSKLIDDFPNSFENIIKRCALIEIIPE